MPSHNLFGGEMQVAGAAVVTEAGPMVEHIVKWRSRQAGYSRKSRQETPVVRNHRGDSRLLQHYFGHPDAIGVAGAPPIEIAFVAAIPGQQPSVKKRQSVDRDELVSGHNVVGV